MFGSSKIDLAFETVEELREYGFKFYMFSDGSKDQWCTAFYKETNVWAALGSTPGVAIFNAVEKIPNSEINGEDILQQMQKDSDLGL